MQVALAIATGQRDINTLTNMVFYAKHRELPIGYKIQPGDRELMQNWLDLRERVLRPLVRALESGSGPTTSPAPARTAPRAAPRAPASEDALENSLYGEVRASWERAGLVPPSSAHFGRYRLTKDRGWARYISRPYVDDTLTQLRERGLIRIDDDDIEMLQRASNVETGGMLQALNSWDSAFMSIGFQDVDAAPPAVDASRGYGRYRPTRRTALLPPKANELLMMRSPS